MMPERELLLTAKLGVEVSAFHMLSTDTMVGVVLFSTCYQVILKVVTLTTRQPLTSIQYEDKGNPYYCQWR